MENNIQYSQTIDNSPKIEDNFIAKPVEIAVVEESPNESSVDPSILKYRKMIQVGVPRGAVELKMVTEGLDPKLL